MELTAEQKESIKETGFLNEKPDNIAFRLRI
jgi:hypothetical protein